MGAGDRVLVLGLALLAGPSGLGQEGAAAPAGSDAPTSLVLLSIDTLRQDALGCYGNPANASPHLDALAARAVRYEQAISQAPWTSPSMAALHTSRFPRELGIKDLAARLPPSVPTLAEVLHEHGYRTAGVVANPLITARHGFHRGFDEFDQEATVRCIEEATAEAVTDQGIAYLEAMAEGPFLLWLHYMDPHANYLGHDYDLGVPAPEDTGRIHSGMPWSDYKAASHTLNPAELAAARHLYDSEVRYVDEHVGRLLAWLEEHELLDRCAVCVVADHGEEFKDHGGIGHVNTVYDELVRVPLLLKFPGQREGAVVKEPVAVIDVFPTFLALAGAPVPEPISGQVLPRNPGEGEADRLVVSETEKGRVLSAAFLGALKLVESDRGAAQLYDLAKDPGEERPISAGRREDGKALVEALHAWREQVAKTTVEANPDAVDPEVLAQMRALGYIGDDEVAVDVPKDSVEVRVETFRIAWNAGDRDAVRALLPENARDSGWAKIEEVLAQQGWSEHLPTLGEAQLSKSEGKVSVAVFRAGDLPVRTRWQVRDGVWNIVGLKAGR